MEINTTEKINESDNSETNEKSKNSSETVLIKETPYRFVIITVFSLLAFSNTLQWVTFSPIADSFKNAYGLSTFSVNLFSLLYMIIYPLANFPSNYIIDEKSIRLGILIAALLTISGAGLKIFINSSMIYPYIGQTLAAIASVFIQNAPAKVGSSWFRDETRVVATSICVLANGLGCTFGYIIQIFFIDEGVTNEVYQENMRKYLIGEFIICLVLVSPTLIFFKSNPKNPPSHSKNNQISPPLKESLKLLVKNISFWKLLLVFIFISAYLNLYSTIFNQNFGRYNLSAAETSYAAMIGQGSGLVGSFLISMLVGKYGTYKKILIWVNIMGIISQIIMTVSLEIFTTNTFIVLTIPWIFCSITNITIYSISFDYVVELTFPVGETISAGLLMVSSQFTSVPIIISFGEIMDSFKELKFLPNCIALGLFVISLIGLLLLDEKLLRLEKEKEIKNLVLDNVTTQHSTK